MQKTKTAAIVWFRNNLRVDDNQALTQAINRHNRVIAVYHLPEHWLNETTWGFRKMERFRAQFLLQTLTQLQKDLARLNISLWVSVGNWTEMLRQILEKYQISDIYGQSEWTQEEVDDETQIPKTINTHWYYDQFLFHPEDIPMEISNIPEVFTVFRKKCEKQRKAKFVLGLI